MKRQDLINLLGARIYQRALKYHDRHKVFDFMETESAENTKYITAIVNGKANYNVEIWINTLDNSLRSANCNCAFNQNGDGELCKHIGATLLEYIDNLDFIPKQNINDLISSKIVEPASAIENKMNNAVSQTAKAKSYNSKIEELFGKKWKEPAISSDTNATSFLNYYKNSANLEQSFFPMLREKQFGNVELKLEFTPDPFRHSDPPEVRLRISNGTRFYVVKDILAFLNDVDSKNYASYGKSEPFSHDINVFDLQSQKLIEVLRKQRSIIQYLNMRLNSYGRYHSSSSKSDTLVLAASVCDDLYDLYSEQGVMGSYTLEKTKLILTLSVTPQKGGAVFFVSPYMYWYHGENWVYCFDDDKIWRVSNSEFDMLKPLFERLNRNEVFFSREDVANFCSYVWPEIKGHINLEDEQNVLFNQIPLTPIVQYYVDAPDYKSITAYPVFVYAEDKVHPLEPSNAIFLRDKKTEDYTNAFLAHYMHSVADRYNNNLFAITDENEIFTFFDEALPLMLSSAEVYMSEAFRNMQAPRPNVQVGISVSGNILDLTVDTGEFPVEELKALLKTMRTKKKYHRLRDGRLLKTDRSMEIFEDLEETLVLAGGNLDNGNFSLPLYRAPSLDKAFAGQEGLQFTRDDEFRQISRNFRGVADSEYNLPETLKKVLRKYQRTGYRWLRTLDHYGMGGILADDMGLGKTLQVLAYLLSLKEKGETKPSLIVCPASLILNWYEECKKFTPELNIIAIDGNAKTRNELVTEFANTDVVITSYDYLRRDVETYKDITFHACIIDEAQAIKNQNTQKHKAVCKVKSEIRFALTGTPIENRLSELWSIFSFLMPGYLYSYPIFREKFERPIVQENDEVSVYRLNQITAPFILRRMKSDVLKELPPKIENLYHVFFTQEQKALYQASVLDAKERLRALKPEDKLQVFAVLTKLRQLCCDPRLTIENWHGGSAKLDACAELISSAVDSGHRVLLFSQFTSMLDLLASKMDEIGVSHFTLQGSTPKPRRAQLVNDFNSGMADVFLISLKAGGTGLNLTAADIVIHYDPWWNVAAQNQATDRAYRIGQTNTVQVYKLIMQGSIEEKIIEMQAAKQNLASMVTGSEGSMLHMSPSELLALLEE